MNIRLSIVERWCGSNTLVAPPTSEIEVRILARPQVGKLVVACQLGSLQ